MPYADAPLRASMSGEYGFPVPSDSGDIDVFIDGDRVRNIVAYDVTAGWVEFAAIDDHGRWMRASGGDFLVKRAFGAIRAVVLVD